MAMKTGNYNVIQSAELDEYELEKEWQDINWHYVEHNIFKLQRQIFRAEKEGNNFKCLYFDNQFNYFSAFAKFSDLGKKQYNSN